MSTVRRRLVPYFLLGPGLVWLVLFFVVPLYFMGRLSLESGGLTTGGFEFTWEFANYRDALELFQDQFVRSFIYAGAATLLALLIAYPLAYAIAFELGRWRYVFLFAVIAPFFTSYLIRTIGWQTILSDDSPVVGSLQTLGLLGDDGRLLATPVAVISGLTYTFLPFMILPIYASLERVDRALIEAAKDLYASAAGAFWHVTLRLSAPGVVAGTLLCFIPAAGDYVNAYFLGGTGQAMIGNVIRSLYLTELDYPQAAALAFTLVTVILVMVVVYIRFAGSSSLMGEEVDER